MPDRLGLDDLDEAFEALGVTAVSRAHRVLPGQPSTGAGASMGRTYRVRMGEDTDLDAASERLAKTDSVANRRLAFDRTRSKEAVGKLFTELGPRYQERPGGYIRIMKCGYRAGDKAPMAYVELVDRPEPEIIEDDED